MWTKQDNKENEENEENESSSLETMKKENETFAMKRRRRKWR